MPNPNLSSTTNDASGGESGTPNVTGTNVPAYTVGFLTSFVTKTFDGNSAELSEFISNCNMAFNFAHQSQESVLLGYIITRISGNARAQLSSKNVNSWDQLREILTTLYADRKHYGQLMQELNNTKQNTHESVRSYYNRIDRLTSRLINSISDANERVSESKVINGLAKLRFIHHSLPDISKFLRSVRPDTLPEALGLALEEEKALEMIKTNKPPSNSSNKFDSRSNHNRFNSNSNNHQNKNHGSVNRPYNNNYPSNNRPHSNNNNRPNNGQTSRPNFNNNNSKFCNYCKKNGHVIADCYKRNRQNNSAQISHVNPQPKNEQAPQGNVVPWDRA